MATTPQHERLNQLGDRIAAARKQAEDALGSPLSDPRETHEFHESGSIHPHEDDQTIAPG